MNDLRKWYGPVRAVNDVAFSVSPGSVHALCGENGAGKSTVFRIISGEVQPDRGTMTLDGQPYEPSGVSNAVERGVSIVHQEYNLVTSMSVAENLFLGRWHLFRRGGRVNWSRLFEAARAQLDQVDLGIDPRQSIRSISPSDQKLLELARALSTDPRLILLDEITASLHQSHCDILFDLVRKAAEAGKAVVYVSHRLDEIFSHCTDVTVLKDGEVAAIRSVGELDEESLTALMIGRSVERFEATREPRDGERPVVFAARSLKGAEVVEDVSLEIREGEVLGIAGLSDSGADELLDVIFGSMKLQSGDMTLENAPYAPRSPVDAIAKGVALVPKERATEGLIGGFSIRRNIGLANLQSWSHRGVVDTSRERREAERGFDLLRIKARSPEDAVDTLSGGNKQKVLLAKWLLDNPRLLLLNNPTRGVDVGVKFEIYQLLERLRHEMNLTIILVSEDMGELIRLSHRVVALRRGVKTAEFEGDAITEDNLISAML